MGLRSYPSLREVPEKLDLVDRHRPVGIDARAGAATAQPPTCTTWSSYRPEERSWASGARSWRRRSVASPADNDVRVVGCNCIGVLDSDYALRHVLLRRGAHGETSQPARSLS